jgi:threonine aldolase
VYLRKQATQLSSKMRFVAAQLHALLGDGLWLELAAHANAMAADLHRAVVDIPGVQVDVSPPAVNSVFPSLDPDVIEVLRAWSFFWDWDVSRHQVRWMTSWDTTRADVERFVEGVTIATGAAARR